MKNRIPAKINVKSLLIFSFIVSYQKFTLKNIIETIKKGELQISSLQISSLQISSFSRNSGSQLQPPYFRLCKERLWTMLSQLVMLKKNKRAVTS